MENQAMKSNEGSPESNQARFDVKTLEAFTPQLESILNNKKIPFEQHAAYRDALFTASPTLADLLNRYDIKKENDIATLKERLEILKKELEENSTVFLFAKEERKREPEAANDNEEKREGVMALQAHINELYRLNQQAIEQQDRLKEELVNVDLFVNEKNAEIDDVLHTKMRIDHYHEQIERLQPEGSTGFLNRFFQKNPPSSENDEQIQGLIEKIIKAQESLDTKYHQLQRKESKMQERLRILQSFLGEPVAEPGEIHDWHILVQQTREALEKFIAKLENDYEQRQSEIEESEHQRDSIASLEELVGRK